MNAQGTVAFQAENAAVAAAEVALGIDAGTLAQHVDHIMVCLPEGTTMANGGSFIAYGYVDGAITVFNDPWCRYLSTQMVRERGCVCVHVCMRTCACVCGRWCGALRALSFCFLNIRSDPFRAQTHTRPSCARHAARDWAQLEAAALVSGFRRVRRRDRLHGILLLPGRRAAGVLQHSKELASGLVQRPPDHVHTIAHRVEGKPRRSRRVRRSLHVSF